jgi:hypothetical protein
MRSWPSRTTVEGWPVREYDMTALTSRELELARRELTASLALARPGSAVRGPILACLSAITTELAERGGPSQVGEVTSWTLRQARLTGSAS